MKAQDVAGSRLTSEQIRRARTAAAQSGRGVGVELQVIAGLEPREFVQVLGELTQLDVVETSNMFAWRPAVDLLPLAKALKRGCALFRDEREALNSVISDPFDVDLQDWLSNLAGGPVVHHLALRTDIQAYLAKLEESVRAMDVFDLESRHEEIAMPAGEQLSITAISADESEIVRIVNSTLYDAIKEGASDIHLRSVRNGLAIKYRVDGVLGTASMISGSSNAERIISRIKVMAELDIAERRVPQDGKLKVNLSGRPIDVRVSVMPTIYGEDAVLRILDKHSIFPAGEALHLDMLGFDLQSLVMLRHLVTQAYGMLLVTGPTGSGKTTTLYAAISEINHGRDNFLTIEDPVEYELPGVAQIPVNEAQGLTFERGLRSILRHDPDRIMVGEIRDRETADMAVQAALTGHLVLTTVHANNAYDVINRFTYLGTDMYALTSALNGIVAQRLVRIVCRHCAARSIATVEELRAVGLEPGAVAGKQLLRGTGCGDCRGTGYKGRKAVVEIITMDDTLRRMIAEKEPVAAIKARARATGTHFLREAALELAMRGETTLEEVARVTLQA